MTEASNSVVSFKSRQIKAQSFLDVIGFGVICINLERMVQNASLDRILRITKVYIIVW